MLYLGTCPLHFNDNILSKYNFLQLSILRGTTTTAARLNVGVSNKQGKTVGYWLLGCSGMVMVAVVLGITVYFIVFISICIVLKEVINKTVK